MPAALEAKLNRDARRKHVRDKGAYVAGGFLRAGYVKRRGHWVKASEAPPKKERS